MKPLRMLLLVLVLSLPASPLEAAQGPGEQTAALCEAHLSAEVREDANNLHLIWQETNNYLTRYKVMKDANGKPIRNLDKYLRKHKIPSRYRFYRRNQYGVYEEDITQIPPPFLAPSNILENIFGGVDYRKASADLMAAEPANLDEAVNLVLNKLQWVHTTWRNRVSWGAYEPEKIQDLDVYRQYTNYLPLYRFSANKGLIKGSLMDQALKQVGKELSDRRFDAFRQMSLADAYVEMRMIRGFKPNFVTEPEMAEFFKEKLPERLPLSDEFSPDRPADYLRILQTHYREIAGVPTSRLGIVFPSVPPGSDAQVFLLKDSQTRKVVAAVKVQQGHKGLDEIVSTLAGESILADMEGKEQAVRTLHAGQLGEDRFFIIQDAAKEVEVDALIGRKLDRAKAALAAEITAASLRRFHGPWKREFTKNELKVIRTFQGNCYYDIASIQSDYLSSDASTLRTAVELGELTKEEAQALRRQLQGATSAYDRLVELRPELLSPTRIHGDFHGGNIFVDPTQETARIIDYSGIIWFLGNSRSIGTGDRGSDLGRMAGNIFVETIKAGGDLAGDALPLVERMVARYKSEVGVEKGSEIDRALNTSILFYMNRFFAVNGKDFEGKKLKASEPSGQLELRRSFFGGWAEAQALMARAFSLE